MTLLPAVTALAAGSPAEVDVSAGEPRRTMSPIAGQVPRDALHRLPSVLRSECDSAAWSASHAPNDWEKRPSPVAVDCLQGLVFDLGDVLFDATVWRRWLLRLLRRFGVRAPYDSLFRRWESEYLADVYCGQREYDQAFLSFLASLGLSRGQIAEIAVGSRARHGEFNLQSRPYPGVVPTLRQLRRLGYRLAVLTNSARHGDELRTALKRLGLDHLFAAVITSIDVGTLASCDDAYRAIHDHLRLRVGEALFVGHDHRELAAAARFGMPTAAFNYEDRTTADVHIDRFEELVSLLTARRHAHAR